MEKKLTWGCDYHQFEAHKSCGSPVQTQKNELCYQKILTEVLWRWNLSVSCQHRTILIKDKKSLFFCFWIGEFRLASIWLILTQNRLKKKLSDFVSIRDFIIFVCLSLLMIFSYIRWLSYVPKDLFLLGAKRHNQKYSFSVNNV